MNSATDISVDIDCRCDGYGCDEKATREIKVDAGKFGTLTLFLCTNCIGKFEDD